MKKIKLFLFTVIVLMQLQGCAAVVQTLVFDRVQWYLDKKEAQEKFNATFGNTVETKKGR